MAIRGLPCLRRFTEKFIKKCVAIGWFSADRIVAKSSNSTEQSAKQSAALLIKAVVSLSYVAVKPVLKLHKNHTERIAERAAHRAI